MRILLVAAAMSVAACGGGSSGSSTIAPGNGGNPPPMTGGNEPPSNEVTAPIGLWKGTLSASTDVSSELIGFVAPDGLSIWMTPDGRAFEGTMPPAGERIEFHVRTHAYYADGMDPQIRDGTMHIETHSRTRLQGQLELGLHNETFRADLHPAWDRPASLEHLAGVYTRSVSSGYTMTMSITTRGEITASDTWGCQFNGSASVPDPSHNLYRIDGTTSACGTRDGEYHGLGALLDADAMGAWIDAMHALEHGDRHASGGHHGPSGTAIAPGAQNLFLFCLYNDQQVFMDTLGR